MQVNTSTGDHCYYCYYYHYYYYYCYYDYYYYCYYYCEGRSGRPHPIGCKSIQAPETLEHKATRAAGM